MALAEREGKMSRDHRGVSEGKPVGQRNAVAGRKLHVLRVSTPALDAEHPSARAARLAAARAVRAAATPDSSEDRDAVADLHALGLGTDGGDHSRRVVAQDERQGDAVVTAVLSHLKVERPVDRDGVNCDQDLTGPGARSLDVLPPQDVGAAELPEDDGLQTTSSTRRAATSSDAVGASPACSALKTSCRQAWRCRTVLPLRS